MPSGLAVSILSAARFNCMNYSFESLMFLGLSMVLFSGCAGTKPALRDIAYVPGGHARQSGDLYLPEEISAPVPVVVLIHGGGWTRRDRSDMTSIARRLTGAGFAVYNIEYRLAPEHRHPAQIEDVRAALAFLPALAEKAPVDASRVALFGYSAGGQLALLAAATAADDTPIRAVAAGGAPVELSHYTRSPFLHALFGGGPDEYPKAYAEASPLRHVGAEHPPTYLYHGRPDLIVEVSQSRNYARALEEKGVEVVYRERLLFGHLLTFTLDGPTTRDAIRFFKRHLTEFPEHAGQPEDGGV